VRSVSLDKWDPLTTAAMVLGGNVRARAAFSGEYRSLHDKYQSDEAVKYAALLKSEVSARVGTPAAAAVSAPAQAPQKRQDESNSILDARLKQYAGARSISSSDFNGRQDDDSEGSSCWGCC
jgi:hypothetical protein